MGYKRTNVALENTTTQVYISFRSYLAQNFENFLQIFQANRPIIHMSYPEIYEYVTYLMNKFMQKNILSQNPQENVAIYVLMSDWVRESKI